MVSLLNQEQVDPFGRQGKNTGFVLKRLCRSRLAGDGDRLIAARLSGLTASKPAPTGGVRQDWSGIKIRFDA
jgi:hypothetical protein